MSSRKQRGCRVPGFGLPLKWQQEHAKSRHSHNTFLGSALDGSEEGGDGPDLLTVGELLMLALMNELTDTPWWAQSIHSRPFTQEWKSYALAQHTELTGLMADWCIRETQERTTLFHQHHFIAALDHGIFKSDIVIPSSLGNELQTLPGSLERRVDIKRSNRSSRPKFFSVDPSLYPLCFGKSKYRTSKPSELDDCIHFCGKGKSMCYLDFNEDGALRGRDCYRFYNGWSIRYQWLPCDVGFDQETGKTYITSYINNAHPQLDHRFYTITSELLSATIPMLNASLTSLKAPKLYTRRIDPEQCTSRKSRPDPEPGPYQALESRARSEYLDKDKRLDHSVQVDLQKEFWDIGFQTIIQVYSVSLSDPDRHYPGEDWHVQGQLNERICASVLYCYGSTNLTTTSISFRHRVSNDEAIWLNTVTETTKDTEDVYGIKDLGPAMQELGTVKIQEGRVITFPNVFQTRINPFSLADCSKPGHCKLMIIHLVDPNRRIMSTANVPCQQRDWWAHEIRQVVPVLRRLPLEIFDRIIDLVDGYPISRDEAERIREDFMKEREEFRKNHTEAMLGRKFSLMSDARRYQ